MKKVSMKKIAFVMTIAVAVAWNFPTALIAGASERVGAVDVLDTTETATTECAVLTTESELEENEKFSGISTSTNVSVPVETTTECVVTTSNVEFGEDTKYTDSSTEQQEQLSELKAKGKLLFGEFPRKEKEILGEIEQDSARVTMEDVSNLLASENDFQQVYNGMLAIAGCPDFIGGSGVTDVEFWLNETGAKKILLILEQKDIIYVDCSEDGTVANSELLYSGKQGSSSIVTTTSTTPVETTTECVVTTSNVAFGEDTKYTDSSTEQQEQLSELKAKGKLLFGEFPRKEKEILGEIEQDSARVTMEDVSNLLASENDFQQVYNGMLAIAGCPDFIGGSGVTDVEFWLNETGAKKILLILEQKDIIYVDCSEDGTVANSELLYSGKQGPSSIVDKALLVGSYKVYNDIAGLSTTTTENTSVTTTSTTVVSVETTSTSSEETATTTQTEVTSEEPMETSASDITTTATFVTTSTTESSGLPQTGYRVSSKDAAMLGTALILIGSALVSYVSRKHE